MSKTGQRHGHRQQTDSCQRKGVGRNGGKKGKGVVTKHV